MTVARESFRRPVVNQEQALVDLAHRLDDGWYAVHIHLSRISRARRNENVVFALQMFEKFIRDYDGHFLILKNGDWVFLYRDLRGAQVRAAVGKLRHLFAGDAGSFNEEKYELAFSSWYDLTRERDQFIRLAEMLLAEKMGSAPPSPVEPTPVMSSDVKLRSRASELVSLGRIVDAIERTDLDGVIRRQPVCLLADAAPPGLLFDEVYFSIDDLERTLARGPLLSDDLWCFQFVTRALDGKLLASLRTAYAAGDPPNLSVNLNVASVLGLDFADFDAAIPESSKRTLAIEFQFVDVFADIGAFLYARDLLQERGYRVFLDGLTDLHLPFVDRGRFAFDMLKLRWSPALLEPRLRDEVAAAVDRAGPNRMILCRCDGREAIDFGRGVGIATYQGRYIASLLSFGAGQPSFLAAL